MASYTQVDWMPLDINKNYNEFLDWLMGYLKANLTQISLFKLGL